MLVLDKGFNPAEAYSLRLDSKKAKTSLGWKPKWNLETSLDETYYWYKESFITKNMQEFSLNQIKKYHDG